MTFSIKILFYFQIHTRKDGGAATDKAIHFLDGEARKQETKNKNHGK